MSKPLFSYFLLLCWFVTSIPSVIYFGIVTLLLTIVRLLSTRFPICRRVHIWIKKYIPFDLLLLLYCSIGLVIEPFLRFYTKRRIFKNKEHETRYVEKFGLASHKVGDKKIVWIHAASVGEVMSIAPLIYKLSKINEIQILITTCTLTSAKIVNDKFGAFVIHQFAPLDVPQIVTRFLRHWEPSIGIFVDSEIWPNLILQSSQVAKLYLVNARLSDKSYRFWKYLRYISPLSFSILMRRFTAIFCGSRLDYDKFSSLAIGVTIKDSDIGHTKYDSAFEAAQIITSIEGEFINKLITKLGSSREIVIFSSTHPGEEEIIAKIHLQLKIKFPRILTIIAPRHISRIENDISDILRTNNIDFFLRSEMDKSEIGDRDILIIDAMGELMQFYCLSNIAVVCGSLIDGVGGHNMLEPASLGKPVLTGPYISNFVDICNAMVLADAIIITEKYDDQNEQIISFSNQLSELLSDKLRMEKLSKNAKGFVESKRGMTDKIFNQILTQ